MRVPIEIDFLAPACALARLRDGCFFDKAIPVRFFSLNFTNERGEPEDVTLWSDPSLPFKFPFCFTVRGTVSAAQFPASFQAKDLTSRAIVEGFMLDGVRVQTRATQIAVSAPNAVTLSSQRGPNAWGLLYWAWPYSILT